MIELSIPGRAVAKARPRVTKRGTFTPKKTRDYEKHVANLISEYMKQRNLARLEGALRLNMLIYRPIPASWPKEKQTAARGDIIRPTSKPDIDNEIKAIMDAMNGVCLKDDAQIVELLIKRHYTEAVPFVFVQLYRIGEGSN